MYKEHKIQLKSYRFQQSCSVILDKVKIRVI